MSELWLRVGDREFEGRKENMELFLYLGELAVYNHIDLKGIVKHKIFRHEDPPYEQLEDYMMQNGYPMSVNQVHVDAPVKWHYEKHLAAELDEIDRYYELLEINEGDDDEVQ